MVSALGKDDIDLFDFYSYDPLTCATLQKLSREQLLPNRSQAGLRTPWPTNIGRQQANHTLRRANLLRRRW